MSQLAFDEDTAKRIESLYLTGDAERRRRLVREALATQKGDRVIDVGCGPGFYCLELADEVGPQGAVVGIDSAAPMLALAARRCQAHQNVYFQQAEVLSLQVDDATFDKALCVQVLEYVDNATAGLVEMYRALRPGGRIVIWDTDWATISWHSSVPARMDRVLKAWDSHLAHPSLPRTLGPRLQEAGFGEVEASAHDFTIIGTLSPDALASVLTPLIAKYVVDQNLIDSEEAAAWQADQNHLSERGEVYYTSTQFCFTGIK